MFSLNTRFEQDSILITTLDLCQVRLQNDSRYLWLVLIPEVADKEEVHELSTEQQHVLIEESSRVATVLQNFSKCDKVNIANLGNIVRQLHWHIVARFNTDEAWPGPIWGVGHAVPYPTEKANELVVSLSDLLSNT